MIRYERVPAERGDGGIARYHGLCDVCGLVVLNETRDDASPEHCDNGCDCPGKGVCPECGLVNE